MTPKVKPLAQVNRMGMREAEDLLDLNTRKSINTFQGLTFGPVGQVSEDGSLI